MFDFCEFISIFRAADVSLYLVILCACVSRNKKKKEEEIGTVDMVVECFDYILCDQNNNNSIQNPIFERERGREIGRLAAHVRTNNYIDPKNEIRCVRVSASRR